MKTVKLLLLGLGCSFILSSCSKENGNETITDQTLNYYFNVVTNLETGEQVITKAVSYNILRNYSDQTARVNFYGVRLPDGKAYPSFTVGPVKWSFDNDWNNIRVGSVTTTSATGITPKISDLTFDTKVKYFDDYNGATYSTISYIVDGVYRVDSYPTTMVAWGVTTSEAEGTGYVHTVDNSVYTMEFDPEKRLGDLTVTNFSVAVDNSIMGVTMKNLPCEFDSNGDFVMSADKAGATLVGVPDSQATPMAVENLRLTLKRGAFKLSYSVTIDGTTYNVTCTD